MIYEKRGRWCTRVNGRLRKFNSREEAEKFLGIEDGEEERQIEESGSVGIQQTEEDTFTPEEKSYSSSESGESYQDYSLWAAGSEDGGEA
jgi:viroplasmin and RNaseH domain-containing protein